MNYQEYASQYGGVIEAIGGHLYDTNLYTGAVTVNQVFFTVLRNNLALSNMELAGTLPSPKGFLIRAIRCVVMQQPQSTAQAAAGAVQPGALDNVSQLVGTGVGRLTIGSKFYGQFPLWMLPAGSGMYGVMSSDGDTAAPGQVQDTGMNGYPDVQNVRSLSKPIFIGPQINFKFECLWPAGAVVLTGPAGALTTNIQIILDGDLLRPVQ